MKPNELVQRVAELGIEHIATPFECSFYGFDVTPLPKEAYYVFRGNVPKVVTRPKNAEEVSSLMSLANELKVPVTPRGGGTSGYFQSVPRKSGIVLETLALKQIESVNPDKLTVKVGAGSIWCEIERALLKQGYTLKTYPTSYRSSTVAGWMQTEGLGVGSLAFGNLKNLIHEVEAVLPTGQIVKVGKGEIKDTELGVVKFDNFFKGEGMLGVITQVELEVRKMPQSVKTVLLGFKDYAHFATYAEKFYKVKAIYFLEFVNGAYMDLLLQSGFHAPEHTMEMFTAVIRLEGSKDDVEAGALQLDEMMSADNNIKKYSEEHATEEYGERLKYFRIKNAFTSVTPADISVPTSNLEPYIKSIFKLGFRIALKGEILTPETSGIMFFYVLANELSLVRFLSAAGYQMEIILRAMKYGGAPNGGIGLLNTPYVYGLLTPQERSSFIDLKERLDPNWIMNPGKWTDPPFFLRPSIYFTGMKLLEPVCYILGGLVRRW